MSFGSSSWREWVLDDEEQVFKLLKTAYDLGIRTWDTANMYSNGESERLIGKFIAKYNIPRSTLVILSKCFFPIQEEGIENTEMNKVNRHGLSRKHIFDAVEASVERLGTYIDVLQIHRMDHDTDKEEIMRALHDLVQSGKVRYIGASTMRATEFATLQFTAEKNGWTKFISMQNYYSLIYREEEREMIPFCNETGVGIIPYSPVARGVLARPVGVSSDRLDSDSITRMLKIGQETGDEEVIRRVEKVAKDKGVAMAQVAIAWVLSKGACPIVGFNKIERIEEAVAALKVKLTDDEIKYLEEAYVPHVAKL